MRLINADEFESFCAEAKYLTQSEIKAFMDGIDIVLDKIYKAPGIQVPELNKFYINRVKEETVEKLHELTETQEDIVNQLKEISTEIASIGIDDERSNFDEQIDKLTMLLQDLIEMNESKKSIFHQLDMIENYID